MIDLSTIDVSAFPHWLSPGGEVLLVNADCMAVLPLLPKVDAAITSPPYNCGKDYGTHNDNQDLEAYWSEIESVLSQTVECLASAKEWAVENAEFDLAAAMRDIADRVKKFKLPADPEEAPVA